VKLANFTHLACLEAVRFGRFQCISVRFRPLQAVLVRFGAFLAGSVRSRDISVRFCAADH
jgi:hypothetical protein